MSDQHRFGEYVAALSTTTDLRGINLLDLRPRTDDATEQIEVLHQSVNASPSQCVFGEHGVGNSVPMPRTEAR